jgi:predicted glycogen debranching enzyme
MDAVVGGLAVTPRDGCAVEINALWFLLLAHLELSAANAGREREAGEWRARREHAGRSFLERFWLDDARYLADRWKDGVRDRRVRPNMVIAAALELSPLSADQRAGVVDLAERDLLTSVGLRTLGPGDPDYRGHFRGGPDERDRSYHQGTVWPWLTGFYVEAALRAHGEGEAEVAKLRRLLSGFHEELAAHAILHVAEVFDGDPPHKPGGTIAQAWNSAELLRARWMLG